MSNKNSTIFNPVSKFLIDNWGTLQKLNSAEKEAENECIDLLDLLRQRLKDLDWWNDAVWSIDSGSSRKEAYFYKKSWVINKEPIVRIGIEGFTLKDLLSKDHWAQLYVWSPLEPAKARKLTEVFKEKFTKKEKKYENKGYKIKSGGYLLSKKIKGPADSDSLEGSFLDNLLQEFTLLAELEEIIDITIGSYDHQLDK